MRTNIEIDDTLMEQALAATGAATKREVVEQALRELVRLKGQAKIRESRGRYHWEGDLEAMRRDD